MPWDAALYGFEWMINMLDFTEIYGDIINYVVQLIMPLYEKLTWEDNPSDKWLDRILRRSIIRMACKLGLDDCVRKSQRYLKEWINNPDINKLKDFLFMLITNLFF
jgi:hypothetical protein